jgi:hypothetical protein|tara:strand:- start:1931 stop:2431 length:501 start_codon:yes stop_codon:yes gene_type:complete
MANVQHKDLTTTELHEPKDADSAAANTVYVFDGAGSGTAQKIAPAQLGSSVNNVNIHTLNYDFEDISTAASKWVVCPFAGDIQKIWSVLHGPIITADCVFTFEIGGTIVTNGTVTITQSGSAAGDVDSATPTGAKTVTAGQAIEIISSGASGNAVNATFTFEMDIT